MKIYHSFSLVVFMSIIILTACGSGNKEDIVPPRPPETVDEFQPIDVASIERYSVFSAGDNDVHSYRIPAIVTTKSGALLLFCEARHDSWRDVSYIDVAVKRSIDGGRTWSDMKLLTSSSGDAFANPTPVVDMNSGKIFVFCCRWSAAYADDDNRKLYNQVYLITSDDDGQTWSEPENINSTVVPDGWYNWGFGPGSGIQLTSGKQAGRLIVPAQQLAKDGSSNGNRAIYSDDAGKTWLKGKLGTSSSEVQYADLGDDLVYQNQRAAGARYVAYSRDGGVTWGGRTKDSTLPAAAKGCHASVIGAGDGMLFYCGIGGGVYSDNADERYGLQLWRSNLKGYGWERSELIWEKAASYPDMTFLPDGRLVVAFEAGDGQGFTTLSQRPAGWMRLDIIIYPKEITDENYWFPNNDE